MLTQRTLPYAAEASSQPVIGLVHRLDASSRAKPAHWERATLRLCLYSIPPILLMLLTMAPRAIGMRQPSSTSNAQFIVTLCFSWIAALECFNVIGRERTNREHTGSMAVLASVCVAIGTAFLLLILLGLSLPGLGQWITDAAFLFVASVIANLSLSSIYKIQSPLTRIAIVDVREHAGGIFWTIDRKRVSRYEISGAIRLEALRNSRLACIVHGMDELVQEIQREPVEGVLISASAAVIAVLSKRIGASRNAEDSVRFIADVSAGALQREKFAQDNCLYLLNIGAVPTKTPHYFLIKRAFDIAFSFAAIILVLPLMALMALAIKVTSKGDIMFVQDRVGWNGKRFRMYKFRTMYTVSQTVSDTHWSVSNDARRTVVGRILRKYSLDELPQFFNVLIGDMSVVGPRPERPYFINSFRREIDEYYRRHLVKVGMTGWAQVNGWRGDTCIRTRLMYDLYYLQNWGLIFDLKIVLRTVLCVFCGQNGD